MSYGRAGAEKIVPDSNDET